MTSDNPQPPAPLAARRRRRRRANGPRWRQIGVRFSTEEAELIWAAAQQRGLAVGAWMGEVLAQECAGETLRPSTWQEILDHLLAFRRDVVRARTNIDQLAKVVESSGQDDHWVRQLAEVTDRILGRNDDMANYVATQLGQQRSP